VHVEKKKEKKSNLQGHIAKPYFLKNRGRITCWCSGSGKTSPKIVTLAFDKPLHPGIYET
jgi:hypothetical protein